MVARLALVAALGLAAVGACALSETCPCGQTFEEDPFDPGASFYVGPDHQESDHCFCRCGDGPAERLPPSRTCEAYETACQRPDGAVTRFACE